jgi:hypothetical protein
MSDINRQIWDFLKSKRLTDYACAGVEGNLYCESGCRPNNLQNTYEKSLGLSDEEYTAQVDSGIYTNFVHDSAGYGLAQWTYWSRKQNLLDYAHGRDTSIADLDMQLDFLWQEMPQSLKDKLNSTTSVYDATKIFMCEFERPANQSDLAIQGRSTIAQKFYDQYASGDNSKDDGGNEVTYSNSPLATEHLDLNKNSNPRNQKYKEGCYNPTGVIDKIALHHMAGKQTALNCAKMHYNGNVASANYYIGYDGEICLGVDESRRAWTTGSRECDSYAVTIEASNDGGAPDWHVSDKTYESIIKLIADICKRNGIPRINYTGDKSGNLVMHKWYQATQCPGPYLSGKFADIASKVNAILEGEPEPDPEPETKTLYCVQVGAFAIKSNADKLCKELESQGYKPFVVEKQVKV